MSLLNNQSYRKKISLVRSNDNNKSVQITLSVNCNHEIDRNILLSIENNINDLFLKDYENLEDIEKQKVVDMELAKKDAEIQKELKKQQLNKVKEIKKVQLEQSKKQLQSKRTTLSNLLESNKNNR